MTVIIRWALNGLAEAIDVTNTTVQMQRIIISLSATPQFKKKLE